VHGPLGLVHLDAHHDVWDSYFGQPLNHGTVFRRACEEGLLDPSRCLQAGMRGGLYSGADYAASRELGMEIVPWTELRSMTPEAFGARARQRTADGPTFFTFDVDVVDPAFCPGTGTPEIGGPSSAHALDLVRALRGIDFRAYDVVEVSPTYDGPGQVTALLAATVMFEMLSLVALAREAGTEPG
jgi:agmatinase